ncbi:MAG: type II pantothenate kinase [Clostridiaceae bacterium]|nr:type II pantothenate kinase [Clostridiaceae bacterium]
MQENKIVVGLDIGGSTTKVIGFKAKQLLNEVYVKSNDPIAAAYGGLGKFLIVNKLSIEDVCKICLTGVGASYIDKNLLNCETIIANEFEAVGLGGLYISGLKEAIVVSVGTGTSLIYSSLNKTEHIIGSGVGGGTVLGLSSKIINYRDFDLIDDLASNGDLSQVDLLVGDIAKSVPGLSLDATASNFGNVNDNASNEDLASAILNLVFQSIGTSAVLASRLFNINDIVIVGSVGQAEQAKKTLRQFEELYSVNVFFPEKAKFSTAIGAALSGSNL